MSLPMKNNEPSDHPSLAQTQLGTLLEQRRLTLGLSQKEAARHIGVSPSYLNRLEHGISANPSPHILNDIARAYTLPPADLLVVAGHLASSELPTLESYLRATCAELPSTAISEMVCFCEYVKERYKQIGRAHV